MKKLILALNLATCVLSPAFASEDEPSTVFTLGSK